MSRLLLVFLQEPLPGLVLPRVARKAGPEKAVLIYRALVRVLLRQLSGLTDCRIRICFSPDDAHDAVKFWILPEIIDHDDILLDPALIEFHPQGNGDLGPRMGRAFATAFDEGFSKVAMISSDSIEVSSRWVHAAFAQLNDRHDAVIGPTPLGACHLLALHRHHPTLFDSVPWSTRDAFRAAVAHASEQEIPHFTLPPLPQIHTGTDYRAALDGPLGPALRKAMKQLNP